MRVLIRLYRYIRPYRAWAIVALTSMLLVAMTYAAFVSLSKPLFDELLSNNRAAVLETPEHRNPAVTLLLRRNLPEGQRGFFIDGVDRVTRSPRKWWSLHRHDRWKYIPQILLIVFAVRAIASFFSDYSFQKVGLSTVRDLRNELYESIICQSNRFFTQRPTGELISRIVSDADAIQAAISVRMGDLVQEGINVLVLAVYVIASNTELALFSIIVAPIIVVPIVKFGQTLRTTTGDLQSRMALVTGVLEETIRGARIVKAFCMERFEIGRFHKATSAHLETNLKAQRIQAMTSPAMELLVGICLSLLILYAGLRIHAGRITQGEFVSFILALGLMYAPVKRLSKVNLTLNTAISASDRVFQMLDSANEIVESPTATGIMGVGSGIRYEHVDFSYGATPVLRDVELSIAQGEVVALVGSSGAGKSTIANLLPRFYDVTGGRVTIDGRDLRELKVASLRQLIAYVTQEVVLFNDTVRANISYGRTDISAARVEAAAVAANAHDFIMQLPKGYESQIGESGVLLSGGQRQRLAVARALLKDAPILVLDEATSALDTESEHLVQKALANLMQGRTTLVIAHRLSTIRSADRIIVLSGGRIVETGRHDQLVVRPDGIYRTLYELQFSEEV